MIELTLFRFETGIDRKPRGDTQSGEDHNILASNASGTRTNRVGCLCRMRHAFQMD